MTNKELLYYLEENFEYYNFIKIYKKYTNFKLFNNIYSYDYKNITFDYILIKKYNKNILCNKKNMSIMKI